MKKKQYCLSLSIKFLNRIFLLTLIFTNLFGYIAKGDPIEPQRVSLNLENVSLSTFFREMRKQTSYKFFYNDTQEKEMKGITIAVKDETVENVLEQVFKGSVYTCKIEGEQIIVVKRKAEDKVSDFKGITIFGKVTDGKNLPLPGVTIQLKGTTVGTASDKDGKYVLTVPKGENICLLFSFIGMETKEVVYSGVDTINIVMKEMASELDEVLVVNTGYQNIDKRKLTSAVTSIKAKDIIVPGLNSIDQMLEGHVPGMIFMQNSGQLGATPRLRIRGTSTILGNQEPLWVVDGIVQHDPVNVDPSQINDLDFVNLLGNAISGLNPEDIEQIDVLKDASATAIYGARAANGVIVIMTRKGQVGPPTVSYSLSGSFTRRPHYTDKSVNMMNSRERIALSREVMEKGIDYPTLSAWVGYESVMKDYYDKKLSYKQMQENVSKLESMNTDWFDILMQNSFSHKHTLSVSGGSPAMKYYASLGYNDSRGSIKKEKNEIYNANLNLIANYNRFTIRFNMSGNVQEKRYTPQDIGVTNYAYNTSRAVPARDENGELWYYDRANRDDSKDTYPFNILNDIENSWQHINSNAVNFVAGLDYKVIDPLKVALTLSYSAVNTYQETYHGEKTWLARTLGTESIDNVYNPDAIMPHGGELLENNQRNNSWMLRGQVDFNKYLDKEERHQITALLGGELSSSRYIGKNQTYLGYMPDRGKKVALVNIVNYMWLRMRISSDPSLWGGVRTDALNRMMSGYFSCSYSFKDLYVFNFNVRVDASNAFGDRSNDKLNPIWSLSGRWNIKDDILENVEWVNALSLRGSFGYQGNMLPSETPELIIQRDNLSPSFNEYASRVYGFPNPNLRWEKTSSMNATLDFALLKNKLRGTVSYFYKKTKNAFLDKSVSEINGIESYTVNQGTLINQGVEVSLNITPINNARGGNPDGFRWNFDPQLGQIVNQLLNKNQSAKDRTLQEGEAIDYHDYWDGSVKITGRPLNSFYSYRFKGLDRQDGRPMFEGVEEENEAKYDKMKKEDVFLAVMEYSGSRVPTIQGGIVNTFSYKRFILSFNLTYSLGSKIRLLQLYPNVYSANGTLAPQPLENVRKEFLDRWQKPGDEVRTNIPGILPNSEMYGTMNPWWTNGKPYQFSSNLWEMYDNSNVRVVSGDYLKMQSMSLRYNLPDRFCQRIYLKSAYVGVTGTNLFTLCSKKLKGQDPSTQSGSASSISMSIRPTYSFSLNVSF